MTRKVILRPFAKINLSLRVGAIRPDGMHDVHTLMQAISTSDTLTATAVEVSRTRKIAVYRVDIVRGDGTLLASFTGTVYVSSRSNDAPPGHH